MKTLQHSCLLGILISASMGGLIAQPTVTDAFWLEPNERSLIVPCDTMGIKALRNAQGTGAAHTWDFTSLTPDSTIYGPYTEFYWDGVDLSTDSVAHEFPEATFGYKQYDGSITYLSNTGGKLEWQGFFHQLSDSTWAKLNYSDPEHFITVPATYLDAESSDNLAGNAVAKTEVGTFSAPFFGSMSWELDGYGTLQLPSGTYNNCVRYKLTRTFTTDPPIGESTIAYNTNMLWLSADYELILLDIEYTLTDNPTPVPSTREWRVFYAPNPPVSSGSIPMDIQAPELISSVSLYPNPASDWLNIELNVEQEQELNIELFSLEGKLVKGLYEQVTYSGANYHGISTSELSRGSYQLVITKSNRVVASQTIIIQ